ncbi:ATP-binding protein [Planobispora siamensis]|uniref:Sensor-like histidine kinase SenX3 n=1 Tax=Planobispora siamensis TaxID=936338 RepID=A0A8J3WPM5_9ACTN|nr:ATP-binding protein [Planobispora siamensis]GIH97398.1 hypothetical protein Psi01_80280 [Planobispora siamensis]
MPVTPVLGRTAAFAALYLVMSYLGRMTMIDKSSLSLVWPAAGVAVLWFLAQRHAGRLRWLDVAVFSAATFSVNVVTGASAMLATSFVLANLTQVGVFLLLFRQLLPEVWRAPGWGRLDRVRDMWMLLLIATLSTACGTAVGPTAVWLLGGQWTWMSAAVWMIRNVVSIVLIGAVGIRLSYLFGARGPRAPSALRQLLRGANAWKILEVVALIGVSAAAYVVAFALNHGLPLAFPLLTVTVWAGLRFGTTLVVLHGLFTGAAVVLFTLNGHGPFATIELPAVRAVVAQVFVGLVAIVGLLIALGRDERDALVQRLATAEKAASRQARLLSTIVNSMNDGLAVVDARGRFFMSNPATRRLLGWADDPSDVFSSGHGVLHPDGSPVSAQEMPHRRALAGETVEGMDMLVRNPDGGESRMLNISAIPLPSAEGDRAIVVLHDVTAERRHRDELASFAGVVSHDLLNPLTTMEGWTDILADTITEDLCAEDTEQIKASITRIKRATARMRNLIQDLLAHTTARDAAIAPVPVSLNDVVEDVVTARSDMPGGHTPRFHLGDLHAVQADPALLRQLMDNLIGNAVKYTAPGSTPEVTVTSCPQDPDLVRVEVADRGIGIPPGQHEVIFENFHRAHAKAGYTGSGLGLAICKRIVERHGGTIGVEDNPGGGSLFHFTLPAAHADPPSPESRRTASSRERENPRPEP